jgi:Phosphotransferase enzyme family
VHLDETLRARGVVDCFEYRNKPRHPAARGVPLAARDSATRAALDSLSAEFDADAVSAVIDFGTLTTGDPACDVMVAWTFLPQEARAVFRAALTIDDHSSEAGFSGLICACPRGKRARLPTQATWKIRIL